MPKTHDQEHCNKKSGIANLTRWHPGQSFVIVLVETWGDGIVAGQPPCPLVIDRCQIAIKKSPMSNTMAKGADTCRTRVGGRNKVRSGQ